MITSWSDLSKNISQITWLQLSLVKPDPQPVLDSNALAQFAPETFKGLRKDLVQLIQPSDMIYFSPNVSKHLTNVTVSEFSAEQFAYFPADSITALRYAAFSGLTPSAIRAMTPPQLAVLTTEQFKYLSCKQVKAFSPAQAEYMSTDVQNSYYFVSINDNRITKPV